MYSKTVEAIVPKQRLYSELSVFNLSFAKTSCNFSSNNFAKMVQSSFIMFLIIQQDVKLWLNSQEGQIHKQTLKFSRGSLLVGAEQGSAGHHF